MSSFGQKFANPCKIERWAVVNFSAPRCDTDGLIRDLKKVGAAKGVVCSLHVLLTCFVLEVFP